MLPSVIATRSVSGLNEGRSCFPNLYAAAAVDAVQARERNGGEQEGCLGPGSSALRRCKWRATRMASILWPMK